MEEGAKKKEYSEAELEQMRKARIAFYKSRTEELKQELTFEKLQADVEEHRTRRAIAVAQRAHLFTSEEDTEVDATPEEETKD